MPLAGILSGCVAVVGGLESALAGHQVRTALMAQVPAASANLPSVPPPSTDTGILVAIGGLICSVCIGAAQAGPTIKILLDARRADRESKARTEMAGDEIRRQLDMGVREREQLRDQMNDIRTHLEVTFRFLNFYRTSIMEAFAINREWMRAVASKYGEKLPDGFGNRAFDAIRDEEWDQLIAFLQSHLPGTSTHPDTAAKDEVNDMLGKLGIPPLKSDAEIPVFRPDSEGPTNVAPRRKSGDAP